MNDIEHAERIIEEFEELQKMAAPIASDMLQLELDHPCPVDPEDITAEDGFLYANYEEYHCGETDHLRRCIPLEYLFDNEWEKKAKLELARRYDEKMKKKRLAQEKAQRDREHRERLEYLKLKAKFEK